MAPSKGNLSNLLEFNSVHKVIICRECRYAVQKSAIDSHLLRHKVYRGDRRKLLEFAAQCDILEPYLVRSPHRGSHPIENLAIFSGLRCDVLECSYLTVSVKRMHKHWSDFHGSGGPVPALSSFSHAVKLQTFFRGTQNRYFEVAGPLDRNRSKRAGSQEDAVAEPYRSPYDLICCTTTSKSADFDMETLRYLFHFTTVTCCSIPASDGSLDSREYWDQRVIPLALENSWLMSGLLAVSAFHMNYLAEDMKVKHNHHERGRRLMYQFNCERRRSDASGSELQVLCRRLDSLLECATWTSSSRSDEHIAEFGTILLILGLVERCAPAPSESSEIETLETFTSSTVLDHLHALPRQMADVLGKPADAEDAFAALSAIALLVQCCEASSGNQTLVNAWQSITKWSKACPKRFVDLVSKSDPAAFLVIANWFATLIRQAERLGSWYLDGLSKMAVTMIRDHFSNMHMQAILPLLDTLLIGMKSH